jgi:glycosyltransferase involved in cell wall biosynthesis
MGENITLSIIIPCFNEEHTIIQLLDKVINVRLIGNLHKEIIIIDDGSTDGSRELISNFILQHPSELLQLYHNERNTGKGACIAFAAPRTTGKYIIIQDADLEYDPEDYNTLLKPLLAGLADIVYGSRFLGIGTHRALLFFHTKGNQFLTALSNLFTQINLTDMETCYKMFTAEILKSIPIKEKRFGFEPEITAKISRIKGIKIFEVGISYFGRTFDEGKKINWKDGLRTIYCIFKYNLFSGR